MGNKQVGHSNEGQQDNKMSHTYRVVETRYRTNNYFLANQLRYSEAVNDFRSVRSSVDSLPQMSLINRLQFALEPLSSQI